jgi:hypothetical protein
MPLIPRDPYLRAELEKAYGPSKPKPFKQRFTENLPLYFIGATAALLCLLAITGNLYICIPLVIVAVLFVVFAWSRHWFSDEDAFHRESRKARKRKRKAENKRSALEAPKRIAAFLVVVLMAQLLLQAAPARAEGGRGLGEGLVARWTFDEGSGSVLRDITGRGHNGTLHGDPRWVDGIAGKALLFDGAYDYVSVDDSPELDFGTGNFSYSLWFRLDSIPSSWSQLLCKRALAGEDYEVQISASGQIEFIFGDRNNGYARTLSATYLKPNAWYLVTVVRAGISGRLYINAKLDMTLNTTQNVTNGSILTLACDSNIYEFYKGTMDDVRIWNRALSSEDVGSLYNESPMPDLAIGPDDIVFSNPSPPEASLIAITAIVHNVGSVDAGESGIQFFDGGIQIDKNGTLPLIKPGEATKYTVRWSAYPAGPHNITVRVDPARQVAEADEGNNNATKSIIVQPPPLPKYTPDLTVRPGDISFSVPAPLENDPVMISAQILNVGTGNATSIAVRVLDGKNPIDKDIVLSRIDVNGSYQVSLLWKATPVGPHEITISIDPNNQIAELDETNNMASKQINVSTQPPSVLRPDLSISESDISFSASPPVEGSSIDITVTVRNPGAGEARAVPVRFLDGTLPIATDQLIPIIPPNGGMAQVTVKWTATPAALHDIVAWADPANAIDESDESNNRAGRSILINQNIVNVNHPPRFTSNPLSTATAGIGFSYQVTASDQDGDKLNFSLVSAPESYMSFDPSSGMFTWTPGLSQSGAHRLLFNCSDGRGGLAEQSFIVQVEVLKPLCTITSPSANQSVSGALVIQGTAFRGASALILVQVRVDGGAWKEANGTSAWSFSLDSRELGNGVHRVEARSFDSITESETVLVRFSVRNVDPGVTRGEFPFCLTSFTLAFILSVVRMFYIRYRRRMMSPRVR